MYTVEQNVQIVISLLKAYGIHKVIVSPGTANVSFVGSIQNDNFFTLYSCIDERSAAYMACGIAAETGEPVVISCTGATASRNYMSGLTEAYYRKLPVLAITSHEGFDLIGKLIPQQIDRRESPADIAVKKVVVPFINDDRDRIYCEDEVNKALIALTRNGGGPVVMNLFTHNNNDFSISELPDSRRIKYYNSVCEFPDLPLGKIAIFIGSHRNFTEVENKAIELFCLSNNAVVLHDHTSGYSGKYSIMPALIFGQDVISDNLQSFDLLIHIGEVSGDYKGMQIFSKSTWRISEDGDIKNLFGTLDAVFNIKESEFFTYYSNNSKNDDSLYKSYRDEYDRLLSNIPEIPYSNIWVAQKLSQKLPVDSTLHLGILNSLRSWNFFELPKGVKSSCNVGGFGIDGILSTLIGASLTNLDNLYFCVLGDLAFFYDLGILGNRHIEKNIRIILINNGCGTEFKNYSHMSHVLGCEQIAPYIAAEGHFCKINESIVASYVQSLGFEYKEAKTKEEFLCVMDDMLKKTEKSCVLEVFVNSQDESDALYQILHLNKHNYQQESQTLKHKVKGILGNNIVDSVRNFKRIFN